MNIDYVVKSDVHITTQEIYIRFKDLMDKKSYDNVVKETRLKWKWKEELVGEETHLSITFDHTRFSPILWWYNFALGQVPYNDMDREFKVHSGFLLLYKSVRDEILSLIKTINPDKIKFSGFSLGAAAATLAHEDVYFHFDKYKKAGNIMTFAYGSPRVFCGDFPRERFVGLIRIHDSRDLVTKVPWKFMGYEHAGTEYIINPNGMDIPPSFFIHWGILYQWRFKRISEGKTWGY